jgi:hypothetical protein
MQKHTQAMLLGIMSLAYVAEAAAQAKTYRFPKPRYASALSGAIGNTIDARCGEDQLYNNTQALERLNWAENCSFVKKSRTFTQEYVEETDSWVDRALYLYPVFTKDDAPNNFPLWKPDYSSCNIPADVIHFTNCEVGCYTPDQLISFTEGDLPIGDVVDGVTPVTGVVTLANDATFDSLTTKSQPIEAFTRSFKDFKETIYTLRTASDGSLSVTPGHPIVNGDGFMTEASRFKVGDKLVKADGTLDPVIAIEVNDTYFGKVYNVSPKSNQPTENIVIAQGYLNGSQKFQRKKFGELDRLTIRSLVPADLN